MCMSMYTNSGTPYSIIAFCYTVLNPYTGQMMLYPWKDSAFAIGLDGSAEKTDVTSSGAFFNLDVKVSVFKLR